MLKKFVTENGRLGEIKEYLPGCWVALTKPEKNECEEVASKYGIEISDILAAMDDEESSRIDVEDEYTMILFDIPAVEIRHKQEAYTTIPLGIIWTEDVIITICSEETPILQQFMNNFVKSFSTKKQVRFCYQILLRACMVYQSYLRVIDRKRIEMEERISNKTEDADIISLHELESTLVYFDTSLRANRLVLERVSRYSKIRRYPEDQELLEDVIVENQQAIEMTQIYRDIMRGTRELMSSVIDNRLNNVMKYLASITIVMAIPTIISGIYGMNVDSRWVPLASVPYGFEIICAITALICIITLKILRKRKML
ncbi:MAG: magnesium transporter CorA family protein [Thermoflexaceae bacterium]|nr:magnesium transporter CorA family protein [Thermoflexaceae bacterium]